jgi:ribonuclease HII
LAGPVYAAAVILPEGFVHPLLQDSKALRTAKRQEARELIQANALAWAIARAEVGEIDQINILNASFLAMHRAVEQLSLRPEALLVDGNRFKPLPGIPHVCVVKGDSLYASIAAASILAKTERDAFMAEMAVQYPWYAWEQNKGYPTEAHRKGIREHGPSPLHRSGFRLLPENAQGRLF